MLDGIKDDTSFSNLSNAKLLGRWNDLQAEGAQLLAQAARGLTPEEKPDENCNPEKDVAVPKGPQSPPASSIPDYGSTPALHNSGFQLYGGRPGNQGIEASEDPAPEHRLAPISQAETHTRQPRSEVRVLGDITQRSNFWVAVLPDHPAPPHRSEATNYDGNQSSERLCDSQAIAVINRNRASLNLESASLYGGENAEANTPIDSTHSSNNSQDNMYFNPRDAFQPYGPYPQPPAPVNPTATFQHGPHGSELNPTTYGSQHASDVHASVNPTDRFQHGRQASEANPPYVSPYGSHGSQANAPINPTHPSPYGRQASEANQTNAFAYGRPSSQGNASIDRTQPAQYGRQAAEVVAPTNPASATPYGSRGSHANAPIDLTRPIPYGRQTPEAVAPNNPTGAIPYGRQTPEAVAPNNPTGAIPYGRQTPEAVAPNNPTGAIPYGLYGTPANGPIDPTNAFPYGRQGPEGNMAMGRAYPLPYSRQGLEANASMNPVYPLPYGRQGLEANATINPAYPLPYGRQGLEANATINPAYPLPYGRQGLEANATINPEYPLPYGRQGLEANATINPAYPLPHGRQGLEANATINPAYPLPYGRQGLEANATINPAYPFAYGRQASGANPPVYPPPIPPAHNPEQMGHQLFWIPRLCAKCDKPWHGFGPCLDEAADQNEGEARPDTSSRALRCGICGEPGHSRTRCPKDPARKRARGQKIDKCDNCGRYGHKAERCGNRYVEFWDRAAKRARRENAATQKPTTQSASAPEPKDAGGSVDEGKRDM